MLHLQPLYEEQIRLSEAEQVYAPPLPSHALWSSTDRPARRSLRHVIEINDLLIALRTATEGGDRGGGTSRHLRTR